MLEIERLSPTGARVLAELGLGRPRDLLRFSGGHVVRSTPHRETLEVATATGSCYLKRYRPGAGGVGRIARMQAPAAVEWQRLDQMRAAGIRVPDGLAAVWSDRGDREPSAVLLEGVAATPLDEALRNPGAGDAEAWLRRFLPPAIRRLHQAGFWHRDLYAAHLLVAGFQGEPTLIDVARVRPAGRLSRRRRVKDLAALHFSLAPLLRPSLLLALLLGYLELPGLTSGSRRLLRSVLRKSARISRHAPKYG